ncbi:MAG TPA: Holliday junction branch migration protein RuvA [Lactobacillaceae bacterium]|jgi:Holliday junction DNA helicase RuvA
MYEYLNGTITTITPAYIVLETAGVGYRLNVANPFRYTENATTKVFVAQIVRENEISLYGFWDGDEKILFDKLLGVSGIGPKSALAILANGDSQGLISAIANNDVTYLTQFPGVGKKTAQQIILDLQGKLDDAGAPQILPAQDTARQDALDALAALGYAAKDISRVEKQLAAQPNTNTDDYIRQALKLLVKA